MLFSLNQVLESHSLIALNPKPSGGSHEKDFPEGAPVGF
jgi:hypothetical protein